MWPDGVVTVPPSFDQNFSLLERIEDFRVQELVPELAVEALVVAVLPGTAGLDIEGLQDPYRLQVH